MRSVPKIERECQNCGTRFFVSASRGKRRFCSQRCGYANRCTDIVSRFWSHVAKGSEPDACWLWTAASRSGYGSFRPRREQTISAHRYSYLLNCGPIPPTLCVLHKCDEKLCIRPDHLFLGTNATNTADMIAKGRQAIGERNGLAKHPERAARGAQNGNTKLTAAQVVDIRARYTAGGVTLTALAAEYSVHTSTIHDVVQRKIWQHLL